MLISAVFRTRPEHGAYTFLSRRRFTIGAACGDQNSSCRPAEIVKRGRGFRPFRRQRYVPVSLGGRSPNESRARTRSIPPQRSQQYPEQPGLEQPQLRIRRAQPGTFVKGTRPDARDRVAPTLPKPGSGVPRTVDAHVGTRS